MSVCSRCQLLPAPLAEDGTLFIAPPLAHTQGSLRQFLREAGVPFSEPAPSILAIPLVPGRLRMLGEGLGGVLSQAELRDARSLVLADGAELSISDLAAMQPLSTLVAKIQGDWLLETLREDRLTSHFQPIVSCRRRARSSPTSACCGASRATAASSRRGRCTRPRGPPT